MCFLSRSKRIATLKADNKVAFTKNCGTLSKKPESQNWSRQKKSEKNYSVKASMRMVLFSMLKPTTRAIPSFVTTAVPQGPFVIFDKKLTQKHEIKVQHRKWEKFEGSCCAKPLIFSNVPSSKNCKATSKKDWRIILNMLTSSITPSTFSRGPTSWNHEFIPILTKKCQDWEGKNFWQKKENITTAEERVVCLLTPVTPRCSPCPLWGATLCVTLPPSLASTYNITS